MGTTGPPRFARLRDDAEAGIPRRLFAPPYREISDGFAVASDGQRFLLASLKPTAPIPVTVVLNWTSTAKKP